MRPGRKKLTMSDLAVSRISIQGVLDESWSDYFGTREIAIEMVEH